MSKTAVSVELATDCYVLLQLMQRHLDPAFGTSANRQRLVRVLAGLLQVIGEEET